MVLGERELAAVVLCYLEALRSDINPFSPQKLGKILSVFKEISLDLYVLIAAHCFRVVAWESLFQQYVK